MKLLAVGDCHGHFERLRAIRDNYPEPVFQVGDFGLGFDGFVPEFPKDMRFIRGNHDDPAACKAHPNYAGEFGYKDGVFWCGGAYSIDHAWRRQYNASHFNKVWWPDEELSLGALVDAQRLYDETKPSVVLTHEAPEAARNKLLMQIVPDFRPEKNVYTRTATAFQKMFESHKPKLWVFGHYHITQSFEIEGTKFQCLNELATLSIDTEKL